MNIPRITSEGSIPPAKTKPETAKSSASRSAGEVFKPEQHERLMNILRSEPDVRPEVVERARALIADPNFPSKDTLVRVARGLLNQLDPSK